MTQRADVEAELPAGGRSLWSATARGFTSGSTAHGHLITDVAVIGGGVAGLSTALHLRQSGIETIVLEASQPGSGASGVSAGILAPEFSRGGIAKACALYGREAGERLARLVGKSTAFVFDLIREHEIACDLQTRGFVSPGRSPQEVEALRSDGAEWRALGCPVEFLDAKRTADAIGTEFYEAALYFEHGGALNPRAYANELARVAVELGARVFIDSAVRTVERRDGKWRLATSTAQVTADRVVLAANGGNARLHPSLCRTTLPLSVYEYATVPMSADDRNRCFGAALPYTDRQAYVFSVRLDRDGRVISAVPELFPKLRFETLIREAERRFRDIHSMPLPAVEYAWPGTAYLNRTLLPAVYVIEDDLSLLAIQACNGRGLAINTILGREIAELLESGDRRAIATPLLQPRPVPMHAIASAAPRLAMALARAKDKRL
ncbi:MAG TPA: FAD-dependent oxidoreductase [Steroidobacteraceae bacterium]|nr:FAD-dependent oxidoreductase [Steroidobacteraceae bacterium]